MLQSEFYERTGMNLTGEDYARVEQMYLATQMDKDVFCEEWLKHRDDRIVRELMGTINSLQKEKKVIDEVNHILEEQMKDIETAHNREMKVLCDSHKDRFEDFAKSIIGELDESMDGIYDIIEEEFGIAFIIKTKHERGIELSDDEIQYMVDQL